MFPPLDMGRKRTPKHVSGACRMSRFIAQSFLKLPCFGDSSSGEGSVLGWSIPAGSPSLTPKVEAFVQRTREVTWRTFLRLWRRVQGRGSGRRLFQRLWSLAGG